jgi:hypothetical protein
MKLASPKSLSLRILHQRTVAVRLAIQGENQLLKGRALYGRDPRLGTVLRVVLPRKVGVEFVLAEREWKGEVLPGDSTGCDYLIRLN